MTTYSSTPAPVGDRPSPRRSGAPAVLAGATATERDDLTGATRAAFLQYWQAGRADFPPALQDLVDYWARYHLVKAVTATAFLAVLIALALVLWRDSVRRGSTRGGAALAGSAGGAALLALLSVPLVLANVQGTLVPFSSLMTLLPLGRGDGDLGVAIGQVQDELGSGDRAGWSPALRVMVDDFGRYHAVVATATVPFLIAFLGLAVLLWRGRARTVRSDRRSRRFLLALSAGCGMSALLLGVLCYANVSVAMDPAPALLLFFQGSY